MIKKGKEIKFVKLNYRKFYLFQINIQKKIYNFVVNFIKC